MYKLVFIAKEARAPKTSSRSAQEAPSVCMYRNRRQRIKSFKMILDASVNNKFSHFYVLISFLNLIRSLPSLLSLPTVLKIRTWNFDTTLILINFLYIYLSYFGNYALFGMIEISLIFGSFLYITFDTEGNSKFWWFYQKDLVQVYQNQPCFQFIVLSIFLGEQIFFKNFVAVYFKLLPKYDDFGFMST